MQKLSSWPAGCLGKSSGLRVMPHLDGGLHHVSFAAAAAAMSSCFKISSMHALNDEHLQSLKSSHSRTAHVAKAKFCSASSRALREVIVIHSSCLSSQACVFGDLSARVSCTVMTTIGACQERIVTLRSCCMSSQGLPAVCADALDPSCKSADDGRCALSFSLPATS